MAIVTSSIRERTSAGEYRGASAGMVVVDVDVDDDADASSSLIVCYCGDSSVLAVLSSAVLCSEP